MVQRSQFTAIGIDVGGLSQNGTVVACLEPIDRGNLAVTFPRVTFAANAGGESILMDVWRRDDRALRDLLGTKDNIAIAIDAPIDLQALPVALCWSEDDKASLTLYEDQRVWELTQRPVDRAFAGLRPLADRIGSLSARMALWFWADDLRAMLGERIFETYPAPIVHRLLDPQGRWGRPPAYKGRSEICWSLGRWQPSDDPQVDTEKSTVLCGLAARLGLVADEGRCLHHDEVDAVVCALVAAGGWIDGVVPLEGPALAAELATLLRIEHREFTVPRGYRLLSDLPAELRIVVGTREN